MVRLPRLFATGLWLAVTLVSTTVVWHATSIVAADVTDRAPAVIPHEDVVSELASGPSPAGPAPTSTTSRPTTSTSTIPPRNQGSVAVNPGATVPTTLVPRAPQPAVPSVPTAPPVAVTTVPPPQAIPRPASPPTTQAPARPTATYSTPGGVVRVACDGFFIDLISAIPNNGYAVQVRVNGPVNIEVHFVRSGQDHSVKAVCFGQPIRYYDQTPTRPGTGSS